MATDLKTSEGFRQWKNPATNEYEFTDSKMHLVSFSGGDKGQCVEFLNSGKTFQLDKDGVVDLVATLMNWLNGDY
jgi:hypothetical protein